jgi:hypothetical protein
MEDLELRFLDALLNAVATQPHNIKIVIVDNEIKIKHNCLIHHLVTANYCTGNFYDMERLLEIRSSINNYLNDFLAPVAVVALCPRIEEIIYQISEPSDLLEYDTSI